MIVSAADAPCSRCALCQDSGQHAEQSEQTVATEGGQPLRGRQLVRAAALGAALCGKPDFAWHLGARYVRAPRLTLFPPRSQQLIEPKAPLALRLAAVLMRGVVQLYSRQLFFLSGAWLALACCLSAYRVF